MFTNFKDKWCQAINVRILAQTFGLAIRYLAALLPFSKESIQKL